MKLKASALTIAGSDPSGGAGIQADLKTFHQAGVYGMSVLTLVTVQNTRRVERVEVLSPELIEAQLSAVLEDILPGAAKTGALGGAEAIRAVAKAARLFSFPLIVDPVMISKHGAPLMAHDALQIFIQELLPLAYLVTPNLHEAEMLSGLPYRGKNCLRGMAEKISDLGPRRVLIKGGHREGDAEDYLYESGSEIFYPAPRIQTVHTHGTGCTASAAITAGLALGLDLHDAMTAAKEYVTAAIRSAPGLGGGSGPVNHWAVYSAGKAPKTV